MYICTFSKNRASVLFRLYLIRGNIRILIVHVAFSAAHHSDEITDSLRIIKPLGVTAYHVLEKIMQKFHYLIVGSLVLGLIFQSIEAFQKILHHLAEVPLINVSAFGKLLNDTSNDTQTHVNSFRIKENLVTELCNILAIRLRKHDSVLGYLVVECHKLTGDHFVSRGYKSLAVKQFKII